MNLLEYGLPNDLNKYQFCTLLCCSEDEKSASSFTSLIRRLLKWSLYWELCHDWREKTNVPTILILVTETMLKCCSCRQTLHILEQFTWKRKDIVLVPICNVPVTCLLPLFIKARNYVRLNRLNYTGNLSQSLNEITLDNIRKYDRYFVRNMSNFFFHDDELCHRNQACILKNKVFHHWAINRHNDFIGRYIINTLWFSDTSYDNIDLGQYRFR